MTKCGISERRPVSLFRTREPAGGSMSGPEIDANALASCGFGDAHEKTPSTLALGVLCQPVGSESSLPIERLPE